MKKTLVLISIMVISLITFGFANDFEIIPKASTGVGETVEKIGSEGGKVRDQYTSEAKKMEGKVGDQLASGVMTWDTLLDYVVYLVKFLSQIGILIGVVMIIYAGYLYATSIMNASNMTKGKTAITNAIIGVLVVIFSYAIMKILTSAFLS